MRLLANPLLGAKPSEDEEGRSGEVAPRSDATRNPELWRAALVVPFLRRFSEIATINPAATAAIDGRGAISYGELAARSTQLAFQLGAFGVGPSVAVGVYLPPGVEVLVAILAIWRCRGIYLPLDPNHPDAYVRRMNDEAQPQVIIATSELSWLDASTPVLRLDAETEQLQRVTQLSATSLVSVPELSDAACLFYTSGTTGKAKGVLTTQHNLAHYLQSAANAYRFRNDDIFVALARFTFSISLFELLLPLWCGGCVRILERHQILDRGELCHALECSTVVHAGPSLLRSLFRHLRTVAHGSRTFPNIRHASSGGDLVQPAVMHEMREVFPNAELYVIYGCSEISCMGTTFEIPRVETVTRTFVGTPFPNVSVRVLDEHRRDISVGEVGEIHFAGDGVTRGYLRQPELNAQKFIELDGKRYYNTGDLGRLHPDGCLEILGRRDFQVQLHGIRIEVAGIERTIEDLQLAAQCAVVAKKDHDDELRLVAFVVQPSEASFAEFRRKLGGVLPDYMIPHRMVVLESMPLTINGKLDRMQLLAWSESPPIAARNTIDQRATAGSARERSIRDAFKQVLQCNDVGLDDDFFDLGGDSLQAMLVLDLITQTTGIAVPPQVLFETGTVRALSDYGRAAKSPMSRPILLNRGTGQTNVYMLSGVQIYRELAKRLEHQWSAYGIVSPREFDTIGASGIACASVEELARDYLSIIKAHQPRGPYYLFGYSFAGIVAYELAQQLRALGDVVGPLVLVDAVLPEWSLGWWFRLTKLSRICSVPLPKLIGFARRRLDEVLRRKQPTELLRRTQDQRLASIQERRACINNETAARYARRMQPFSGSIYAVTLTRRLELDPLKRSDCGWGAFVGSLQVRSIDCDHFQVMTDEPYISQLAANVAEAFEDP